MKKFISISLVAVMLLATVGIRAATVSVATASATSQNVAFLLGTNTPAVITSITLTSTNNQVANVQMFDSYWKTLQITNQAYTTISSYATNYVTLYTNYYGATNTFTNFALVDVTNTVATNNILLTPVFTAFAGTNAQTTYNNLNLKINQGLWLSNSTASSWGLMTITYNQ